VRRFLSNYFDLLLYNNETVNKKNVECLCRPDLKFGGAFLKFIDLSDEFLFPELHVIVTLR